MKKKLMTPGPTPLPPQVVEVLGQQVLHHRTREYADVFASLNSGLKYVFATHYPVVTLTASGTGGMEAAVVNCFRPGDRVLLVSAGVFGDRFYDICRSMGFDVTKLEVPWGKGIGAGEVMERLTPDTRGVIVTHNETSTAARSDIESIGKALKGTGALFIVDAVSSLGGMEVRPEEWGIDIVVTSSQKALMCPPGLTFLSISQRAMEAAQGNTSRRHYWDLCKAVDFLNKQPPQHPFTPAVNIVMASLAAVTLIQEEGLENVWLRHKRMGKMAREGLRAMGLEPFADERYVSDTLTAVKVPEGIDAQEIIRRMEEDFGIIIAGGNRSLKGKIIRIAHMGYISEGDVLDTLKALEGTLAGLGLPVDEGKAYTAARTIMDIRG
ncbi:MAG: alanine--glyoxylate aminotransferase family protein [Clostridiales bacterium]|nr:alanine--glyoxylate aminotransferase family protein [Clostridiales bacterium]